jgi:hypothetical protein
MQTDNLSIEAMLFITSKFSIVKQLFLIIFILPDHFPIGEAGGIPGCMEGFKKLSFYCSSILFF